MSRIAQIVVLVAIGLAAVAAYPPRHSWCESRVLGEECVPDGEDQWFDEVAVPFMAETQHYAAKRNGGQIRRGFHPKSHGCYRGRFQVVNPTFTAIGPLFGDMRFERLTAYVRFSNGHPFMQADSERDMLGLAIKLVGIPGPKLRQADAVTQDFVLFDLPALPFADAVAFMNFVNKTVQKDRAENPDIDSAAAGSQRKMKNAPFFDFPLSKEDTRLLALEQKYGPAASTLLEFGLFDKSLRKNDYYSGTAYKFGDGQAVRFKAKPCDKTLTKPMKRYRKQSQDPDFYRYDLNQTLSVANRKVCFKLYAQFQKDVRKQPIEKHSSIWWELSTPAVPLGELVISPREFENPIACESLQFSPWNASPEYRPLGSVNRLRRKAYAQSARIRSARQEPTS